MPQLDMLDKEENILTHIDEVSDISDLQESANSITDKALGQVEEISKKVDNSFVQDYLETVDNKLTKDEKKEGEEDSGNNKSFLKSVGSFFSGIASFFRGSKKESKEPEDKRGGWDLLFSTTADLMSNKKVTDGEENIYKQKIEKEPSENNEIASGYVEAENLMRMDFDNKFEGDTSSGFLKGVKSFFGKTWFMTKLLILGQQEIEINDFKYNKYIYLENPTATVRRDKTITIESNKTSVFSEFFNNGRHEIGSNAKFKLDYDNEEGLRTAEINDAEFIGDIKGVHIKALPITYKEQNLEFSAKKVELSKNVFGHDLKAGVNGFSINIDGIKWKSAFVESDDIEINPLITVKSPRFQVDNIEKGLKFNLSSKGFSLIVKKNESIDNGESSDEEGANFKLDVNGGISVSKTKFDDNPSSDSILSNWKVGINSADVNGKIYDLNFNLAGINYNNDDNRFTMDSGTLEYDFKVEDKEEKITADVSALKIDSEGVDWQEIKATVPKLSLGDYLNIKATTFKVGGKDSKYAKSIETNDLEFKLNVGDLNVNAGSLLGEKNATGWHSKGSSINASINIGSLGMSMENGYFDSDDKTLGAEDVSLTYKFDDNISITGGVTGLKYKDKELDWKSAYGEIDELTFFDMITLGKARLEIEKEEDNYIKTITAQEFNFDAKEYGLDVKVNKVIATNKSEDKDIKNWNLKLEGASAYYEKNGLIIDIRGISLDYNDSLRLYADTATASTNIFGADFNVSVDGLTIEDGKPDWNLIEGDIENLNIKDIITVEKAHAKVYGKENEYKKFIEVSNFGIDLKYNNVYANAEGNITLEEINSIWDINVYDTNANANIFGNLINLNNISYSSTEEKFSLEEATIHSDIWGKEVEGQANNVVIDRKGLDWDEASVGISSINMFNFINVEDPLLTFKGKEEKFRANIFTNKLSLDIPSLNVRAEGTVNVEQKEDGWETEVSNGNIGVNCNIFSVNVKDFNINSSSKEITAEMAKANIPSLNLTGTVNNIKFNKEDNFTFERLSIKSDQDISLINDKVKISGLGAEVEKGEEGYSIKLGGSASFGKDSDVFSGVARDVQVLLDNDGIKEGSFNNIDINTNLFDFSVDNAVYGNNQISIESINFNLEQPKELTDNEEDRESKGLFNEDSNYYKFLGLFEGFGITLKEALINNEGFKVKKVELSKTKIPFDLGHVNGEVDIVGKSGNLHLKEINIPKKDNNTWFELDSPGIPIAGIPGLSIYAGVKLGGGVNFAGNAGLKLLENRMLEATGDVSVGGEIVFESHFGLKLGTDYLISLAAEAFAEAKASANAGIDIKTIVSFANHSFKLDEDETKLGYKLDAGLSASIGARLKLSVLKVYNKALYEVKFKEWEFAKIDMSGNVGWENGEISHRFETKDINFIWASKGEEATEGIDTTEGDNLRAKLLEAGKVYNSDDREDPNSRYGISLRAEEVEIEFQNYLESNKTKIEDTEKALQRKQKQSNKDIVKANEHIVKQRDRMSRYENLTHELRAYREGKDDISRENLMILFSKKSLEKVEGREREGEESVDYTQLLINYAKMKSSNKRGLFSKARDDNSRDPEKQKKRYEAIWKYMGEGKEDFTDETLQRIFSQHAVSKGRTLMGREGGNKPTTLTEGVLLHTRSRLDYYEGRLAIIDRIQQDFIDKIDYYEKEIGFARAALEDIHRALSNPKELLEGGDSDILNIVGTYSDEEQVESKKQQYIDDVKKAREMGRQAEDTMDEIISDIEENFINDTLEETIEEDD